MIKRTQILRVAQAGASSDGINPSAPVSIPAAPWGDIEVTDRAETAPTARSVRGSRHWRQDNVLRHAASRRDNS